jgi:hypothetical protein
MADDGLILPRHQFRPAIIRHAACGKRPIALYWAAREPTNASTVARGLALITLAELGRPCRTEPRRTTEQNRARVYGAVRLTLARHEHRLAGPNVRSARRDQPYNGHIRGNVDFLLAALVGHRYALAVDALDRIGDGRVGEVLYQRLFWLTHRGSLGRDFLTPLAREDSRHAFSGQIARGLFGGGVAWARSPVEECQSEPAAVTRLRR